MSSGPSPELLAQPDGYAYRYPDGIRFNGGRSINGYTPKPEDAIGYFWAEHVAEFIHAREQASKWICAAQYSDTGSNDPQDCDYPFCGCSPEADKIIETLQECGWESPKFIHAREQAAIQEHNKHVQLFLTEMYQTMLSPVEEFRGTIADVCELLLERAREDRQAFMDIATREQHCEARVRELVERKRTQGAHSDPSIRALYDRWADELEAALNAQPVAEGKP